MRDSNKRNKPKPKKFKWWAEKAKAKKPKDNKLKIDVKLAKKTKSKSGLNSGYRVIRIITNVTKNKLKKIGSTYKDIKSASDFVTKNSKSREQTIADFGSKIDAIPAKLTRLAINNNRKKKQKLFANTPRRRQVGMRSYTGLRKLVLAENRRQLRLPQSARSSNLKSEAELIEKARIERAARFESWSRLYKNEHQVSYKGKRRLHWWYGFGTNYDRYSAIEVGILSLASYKLTLIRFVGIRNNQHSELEDTRYRVWW